MNKFNAINQEQITGLVRRSARTVDAVSLARAALCTLDAQQRYFKTKSRFDLIVSKSLEKDLRAACKSIIPADVEPQVKPQPRRPAPEVVEELA